MTILNLKPNQTLADFRNVGAPTDGTDSYQINGNDLGDTIYGTQVTDFIYGGQGSDFIDGYFGGGAVIGFANTIALGSNPTYNAGNDTLIGGESPNATNTIVGAAGNDRLVAYYGTNIMWGGNGNNTYYQYDGTAKQSTINQSFDSNANGTNSIIFESTTAANLDFSWHGNDLWLFSSSDTTNQHGVVITNQGLGGLYTIDYVYGSDGNGYNISGLRPSTSVSSNSLVDPSSQSGGGAASLSGALSLLHSSAALEDVQGMSADLISHGTVANAAKIAASEGLPSNTQAVTVGSTTKQVLAA